MMLEYLNEDKAGAAIRSAVDKALALGKVTVDINPDKNISTTEAGDFVSENL